MNPLPGHIDQRCGYNLMAFRMGLLLTIFFTLILCFSPFIVDAQTQIEGIVYGPGKVPAEGVSILVSPVERMSTMIGYSITDVDGKYILTIDYEADSLVLSTRSLNFRDTILIVQNLSNTLTLELKAQVNEIREVSVRGYPILSNGDTLTYIVQSFARLRDHSIGDVIGNMPGFEVTPGGVVHFQGQPIQKYYIEGLDLLEKRYPIANKNLPHGSVASVEVLLNHNPLRILEDRIAPGSASINIKLKNEVALTGTLYGSLGVSPFLRNINLTPMLFNKSQQVVAALQSNNTGDDLNSQHQALEYSGGQLKDMGNAKRELLSIRPLPSPETDEKRYLDNNANLVTYNHLFKLDSKSQIRINSSYLHDITKVAGDVVTQYLTEGSGMIVRESARNKYFTSSLSNSIGYTLNEKNRYIENQFNLHQFWDSESGHILNPVQFIQNAETPHYSLANNLDLLFTIKDNIFQFTSRIDLNNSPQSLVFSPGVFPRLLSGGEPYSSSRQSFSEQNLLTDHSLQFYHGRKPWLFEYEPGVKFENQQIETFMERNGVKLTTDTLQNSVSWNYMELYFKYRIRYERQSIRASFDLQFNHQLYNYTGADDKSARTVRKTFPAPSFRLLYIFNSELNGSLSARYFPTFGSPTELLTGYVIRDHLLMIRQSGIIPTNIGVILNAGMEYKNAVAGLFGSLEWTASRVSQNVILKRTIDENGLVSSTGIEQDNISLSNTFNAKLSRYFPRIKATSEINGIMATVSRDVLVNEHLARIQTRMLLLNPGISFNGWKFADVGYRYHLELIKQNNPATNTLIIQQKHFADLFLSPSARHLLGITGEFYLNNGSTGQFQDVFFANVSYRYKPGNGKLRYRLELNNIFNQKDIVRYQHTDISLMRSTFYLRPRQILATISVGL